MWKPDLDIYTGHRYVAIAEAIGDDIASGILKPGERLPPHRWLADHLGLTTATVAHGYKLAKRRGLVNAKVGSGTQIVARPLPEAIPLNESPDGLVDFGLLKPAVIPNRALLNEAFGTSLRELGNEWVSLRRAYTQELGYPLDREWGSILLNQRAIPAQPQSTVVCQGAQQAFLLLLTLLTRPGDPVMLESRAYLGLKNLCWAMNRVSVPIDMDESGVIPESLETIARKTGARLAFLTPECQNPTGVQISAGRRRRIASISEDHDLLLVEDNWLPFSSNVHLPTLVSMVPDRCFHVLSLSKLSNPTLRIAYMTGPMPYILKLPEVGHSMLSSCSTLDAPLASRWIENGLVERLAQAQNKEISVRYRMARQSLEPFFKTVNQRPSPMMWLVLPKPVKLTALSTSVAERGVSILTDERFSIGGTASPPAFRLSLTTPESRQDLLLGLAIIADEMAHRVTSLLS